MTFDIRKASPEDAAAIVDVLDNAAFLIDIYRGEAGIALVESKADLFWLADLNGRLSSVMIVLPKHDFGLLEISLIVTKPEFRQRGFARSLIQKAKSIVGNSKLALVAYPENEISRKLLASEQFRRVPGRRNVQGHPQYRFSVKP